MYGHGTLLAAAALLVSFGSQAEPPQDAETPGASCFTSLGVRFDDPGSSSGGVRPDRVELRLDGRPCIEINPEGEACAMHAPPGAVCDVIAPLSIAEGWCHMGADGSWSANFQVLSSRLLADDTDHALTATISTLEGTTAREATVVVTRYRPRGPSGASVTCFQGNAAFGSATPPPEKGAHQG